MKNFYDRYFIELWIAIPVLVISSIITYIWTRPSHYCAEYPVIAEVIDIGDKNFKVTYTDNSTEYFDDFYMVDKKQGECLRYEVAPPKEEPQE